MVDEVKEAERSLRRNGWHPHLMHGAIICYMKSYTVYRSVIDWGAGPEAALVDEVLSRAEKAKADYKLRQMLVKAGVRDR